MFGRKKTFTLPPLEQEVQSNVCSSTTVTPPVVKSPPGVVMIPPCVICGERSSGYHYGANTCEACKGFYRRCIKRETKLKCNFDGNCQIEQKKRRSGCAACRFQKCLDAGMSKNAIKIGRYTYEKKTKDIQELNRLELQDMLTQGGDLSSDAHKREKELDRLIEKMTCTHIAKQARSAEDFVNLINAEQQYKEKKELEDLIFGTRKHLSQEDHAAIFESTGLDVDGRTTKIAVMGENVESRLENFLGFCNILPGFTQIPIVDQMELIRESSLERWILLYSAWYNTDDLMMTCPNDTSIIFTLEEMKSFTSKGAEDFMAIWNLVIRLQSFDLTDSESIVAAALALMIADCELSPVARDITTASADYLLEALQHLINKNHDPEDNTLGKIMTLLADLRPLRDHHRLMQREFIKYKSNLMGLPEMMIDIMV